MTDPLDVGRTYSVSMTTAGGVARLFVDGQRTAVGGEICPDLLTDEDIGAADTWRGRVVRAFFALLRAWPPDARWPAIGRSASSRGIDEPRQEG